MKKYLETVEDIEALRNTDTKILEETENGGVPYPIEYYRFVNGVLCSFSGDTLLTYNTILTFKHLKHYIEVEEEPSEDDIGKLGWFWDYTKEAGVLDQLRSVRFDQELRFVTQSTNLCYKHFQLLTPEDVEKYTGYKVVNSETQASGLDDNKIQAKEV